MILNVESPQFDMWVQRQLITACIQFTRSQILMH